MKLAKHSIFAFAVCGLAWGCKTTNDAALKSDDGAKPATGREAPAAEGGKGSLYCAFDSPDGAGPVVEFWSNPSGDRLSDVQSRFNEKKKDGQGQLNNVGSLSAIDPSTMPKKLIRSWFKVFSGVDFKSMGCYDVTKDASRVGYLCIEKADRGGKREAAWITDFGWQQFASELTMYGTTCGSKG